MNRTILRTFLGFLLPLSLSLVMASPVAAIGPGDLDTTFDTDGKVTTDFGGNDIATSVAIQSDGKIVTVGVTHTSTTSPLGDFAVARYNADGSLDTSFDTDGKVTTKFGSAGRDQAWAVAIYKTGPHAGKIVAVGDTTAFGPNHFALARYNADGSLDTSFDTDGKVTTNFRTAPSDIYPAAQGLSVALQSDGKIVVAGAFFKFFSTGWDFALARYNADGSLDTSFGGTGKVITDIGGFLYGSDAATSVAIQSDGRIVAAGYGNSLEQRNSDFALARYNTDGSLDTTFDTDGKVTTDFGSTADAGKSVAIQSDGKLVVAGEFGLYPSADFALARYNTNGSLDISFDTDGKVTTNFGGWDLGQSVAIQSDGGIVAAGHTQSASYALDFAVARYNANGSLDSSFGVGGKVTTDFGGGPDAGHSVAIQSDGKIVVAGSGGGTGDFAVARYGGTESPSNTPPLAVAGPDQTLEQTSFQGASVTLDGSGSTDDGIMQPLTYTWTWSGGSATGVSPAITLPLGKTTVTLTVNDGQFSASDTVDITVRDTTKPQVTLGTSVFTLWPPNHNMVNVGLTLSVSDVCDANPTVVLSVTQDEKVDEDTGEGNFSPDAKILRDANGKITGLELRAERKGNGDGRVYLITVSVTDASGNVATKYATVTVAKSQSKKDIDAVAAQAAVAVAADVPLPYNSTAGPIIGPKQ